MNILRSKKKGFLFEVVKQKTSHLLNKNGLEYLPKYGLVDNHVDYAFVYGDNDKKYLVSSMNMNPENVFITGYPFAPNEKYKDPDEKPNENCQKTVLYLSTALRTVGVIPISIKEEKQQYQKVYQQVTQSGYKLKLKLHPLEDEDLFKSYFDDNDVEVNRIANLSDSMHESDIVIGEYTTAFFYAIRAYKPIIIVNSPFFDEYPFDFTKFGIGKKSDVESLGQTILESERLTEKERKDYDYFSSTYINFHNNETSFSLVYRQLERILIKLLVK